MFYQSSIKKKKILLLTAVFFLFSGFMACNGEQQREQMEEEDTVESEEEIAKAVPKAQMTAGARLFLLCQACHNLKEGEPNKVGPNLHGIFGRKAGSVADFNNYSEGMKASGIVWDEDHLREWLTKPTDYIKGTTMAFIGIQDKEKQDLLIAYLKEETK
ncbi:MAG: cytochrome c family protein [Bacteroidota bacterium]